MSQSISRPCPGEPDRPHQMAIQLAARRDGGKAGIPQHSVVGELHLFIYKYIRLSLGLSGAEKCL